MPKFPEKISILIVVLLVSVFTINESGTEASFQDSANAPVTATAAVLNSTYSNGGPMSDWPEPYGRYHLSETLVPVNDGSARGFNNTLTNNGTIDQDVILKTAPTSVTNHQLIINHTTAVVKFGPTIVYSGPLENLSTTPVLLKVGESKTYTIDLSVQYTPDLPNSLGTEYVQTPFIISLRPNSTPNSSFTYEINTSINYYFNSWILEKPVLIRQPSYFNDTCVTIEWNNWDMSKYKKFTFEYSKNANLSNSTTIQIENSTRALLKQLSLNTTYYYRVKVNDSFRPEWSETIAFTTGSSDGSPYWLNC